MNAMKHTLVVFGATSALMTAACSQSSDSDAKVEAEFQGSIEKSGIGEVKATIDGAPYRGATLDVPSEGTSTAEFRNLGPATTISLQAHDPDAQSVMSNVLSVDFTVAGNDASAPLSDAIICICFREHSSFAAKLRSKLTDNRGSAIFQRKGVQRDFCWRFATFAAVKRFVHAVREIGNCCAGKRR